MVSAVTRPGLSAWSRSRSRGPLPPSVLRSRLSVEAEALVQKHHREQLVPHLACTRARHGQLSWLLHARARADKSRRGGRPTAQPRGKSNKEVAAWAVARLVSTVLDARKWGRPAATAASGHATNSASPVGCSLHSPTEKQVLLPCLFSFSSLLICLQMTEFLTWMLSAWTSCEVIVWPMPLLTNI